MLFWLGCVTAEPEGDPKLGAEVYARQCTGCHGESGEGASGGPSLVEHVPVHTDEEIYAVLGGARPDMPDQGLTDLEAAGVLAWLRDTFGALDPVAREEAGFPPAEVD